MLIPMVWKGFRWVRWMAWSLAGLLLVAVVAIAVGLFRFDRRLGL